MCGAQELPWVQSEAFTKAELAWAWISLLKTFQFESFSIANQVRLHSLLTRALSWEVCPRREMVCFFYCYGNRMAAPHWLKHSALKERRLEKQQWRNSPRPEMKYAKDTLSVAAELNSTPRLNWPMPVFDRQDLWWILISLVICSQKPKALK